MSKTTKTTAPQVHIAPPERLELVISLPGLEAAFGHLCEAVATVITTLAEKELARGERGEGERALEQQRPELQRAELDFRLVEHGHRVREWRAEQERAAARLAAHGEELGL